MHIMNLIITIPQCSSSNPPISVPTCLPSSFTSFLTTHYIQVVNPHTCGLFRRNLGRWRQKPDSGNEAEGAETKGTPGPGHFRVGVPYPPPLQLSAWWPPGSPPRLFLPGSSPRLKRGETAGCPLTFWGWFWIRSAASWDPTVNSK